MPTADNFPLTPLRYWYGSLIAERTMNADASARMKRALESVAEQVTQDVPDSASDVPVLDPFVLAQRQLSSVSSEAQKLAVIVELRATNPFHPHVIQYTDAAAIGALRKIAWSCDVPLYDFEVVDRFWKEANKAFEQKNPWLWVRRAAGVALLAALTAVVVVTAGAAAPAVTTLLATLGGGAIATGGFGMVGGVVVLLMGGATSGALLTMTNTLLTQMGPEGLRAELVKLEVTQRLWWREGTLGVLKRGEVVTQQKQLRTNIKTLWLKEEKISDPKSEPIQSWQKMHELVEKSIARFESLP
ncbi:hypothetical protein [Deinococcus sp. ME38]|uniref:hypothetical protein n=1 Tax=Deinococcus sp. ME38 TaxID=3400344 RepID=UPI003B59E541